MRAYRSASVMAVAALLSAQATHALETVYHFPNGTWIENLALRSNGGILATIVTAPQVVYVDPFAASPTPKTIATFPQPDTAVTGIVETTKDIFYTSAVQISVSDKSAPRGNNTVWRLDLSNLDTSGAVSMAKIANVPQAGLLNGMTVSASGKILMADVIKGQVVRLDPLSGKIDIVMDDVVLQIPATTCSPNKNGINGVHVKDGSLYFTNTGSCSYGRFPIDKDGTATGPIEILFKQSKVVPDDFAVVPHGAILMNAGYDNVALIDNNGSNQYTILANVSGPTAAAFGRRPGDEKTLYVTTSGGDGEYGKSPVPVGGSILKLSL